MNSLKEKTNKELIFYIEEWVNDRSYDLRQIHGLSLLNANVSALAIQGLLNDVGKIFGLLLVLTERLEHKHEPMDTDELKFVLKPSKYPFRVCKICKCLYLYEL